MPAAIPLIAAIVAAAGVGTSIYEGKQSSDQASAAQAANKKALLQQQQAQANQANLSKQEAVLGAQGEAQAQTGGSLTDSGTASLTDLLAGYPGYQAGSGNSPSAGAGVGSSGVSGATGATAAGGTGTTPDIAALLATLRGGGAGGLGSNGTNLSGGNWQSQPGQPQPWQELSNPVL